MASPDASTRAATVRQMAEWEIRGDFEPLRKALSDPDSQVRANSVRALAYTRSPAMRDALLDTAAEAAGTKEAVLAIRATTASCDTTCVPRLLALVRSDDPAVSLAARGTLGELPGMRLQSSYWWEWKDTVARDFDDPVASELRSALEDPGANGELRITAFAMADLLGLDSCSEPLRRWAAKSPEEVGADFKVCTALEHLSRSSCTGPWMGAALEWFPLDPVLSPRVVLREARKDPAAADPVLARAVDEKRGVPRALASWICGVTGGKECFAAVRRSLLESGDETERVAAAWAWSQLAPDDAAIAELKEAATRDASPQVRETTRYGLDRRKNGVRS
jgi:HEAT repeat protein